VDVKQRLLLTASGLCPLLVSVLYQTGLLKTASDVTALGFVGSIFFMLMATFRCNFLDVSAIATGKVLAGMEDGVITFDAYGHLMNANPGFQKISQMLFDTAHFGTMDALLNVLDGAVRERLLQGETVTVKRIQIKCQKHLNRQGQHIGTTFLLKDVSEFYELLEKNRELAAAAERIAVEQERNRIAQEVHDTTGHTLTMFRSLVKLARMSFEQGNETEGVENLRQAEEMAQNGIRALREEINHIRQEQQCALVTQALLQLAVYAVKHQLDE
jgi:signal transduction histidine kinase